MMLCPACRDILTEITLPTSTGGKLNLKKCQTCGGIWADSGVANRLTPSQAETVDPEKQRKAAKSADIVCTRCRVVLKKLTTASIPPDTTVYFCPSCHGNWFPTGQLRRTRKAQQLKLDYLKTFHIPLPSLASVLLPLLILAALGTTSLYVAQRIKQPAQTPIRAQTLVQNLHVQPNGKKSVTISFFTPQPAKTYLKFVINGQPGRLTISPKPSRYHQIHVSGLAAQDQFQISLEPSEGEPFSTAPQPFFRSN